MLMIYAYIPGSAGTVAFRPADDSETTVEGVVKATTGNGISVYVMVPTDSTGNIEYKSSYAGDGTGRIRVYSMQLMQ